VLCGIVGVLWVRPECNFGRAEGTIQAVNIQKPDNNKQTHHFM
jgi:hypothetical protein